MNNPAKLPTVKILETPETRQQQTRTGVRTIYFQKAEVECDQLRMRVEHEIDSVADALPIGSVYEWDVVADLVAGQYGAIDLARRMTLIKVAKTTAKAA